VVVGAGITAALQVGKASIAAPLLQADLGLDLASVGWLTAIFAILGVIGGVPAGAIAASLGDRRILLTGLAATVIGAAIGAGSTG
ncbi:MFS transporter, partial [Enterobacter hormaechei]|uniref:MFS transporter n=1 Tax=Enterobacter hormaechei TaxID=158836 RepID=UPI0013D2083D